MDSFKNEASIVLAADISRTLPLSFHRGTSFGKNAVRMIAMTLRELGFKERVHRLDLLSSLTGREINSTYQITVAEAMAFRNMQRYGTLEDAIWEADND